MVEDFRDLRVYQTALTLQQRVFDATQDFPPSEAHALTGPLRLAARTVGVRIAESMTQRRTLDRFMGKLSDAGAEAVATHHWCETARACGYLDARPCEELIGLTFDVGRQVEAILRDARRWCSTS